MFERLKALISRWIGIDNIKSDIKEIKTNANGIDKRLNDIIYWIGDKGAIDSVSADLHLHGDGDSLIILCSRLRGGMIKFIPMKIKGVTELMMIIEHLEAYTPRSFYVDSIPGLNREIYDNIDRVQKKRERRFRR